MTDHIQVLVWRAQATEPEAFSHVLRNEAANQYAAAGVRVLQVNVADASTHPAAPLCQIHLDPQPEAMLQIAADNPDLAARVSEALSQLVAIELAAAYLVTTREPLPDTSTAPDPAGRTPGFSQVALLRRIPTMSTDAFRAQWLDHHTALAISIQSTFRYVQHVVDRALTRDAPPLDGIVEECFPTEAMTDPHAFFATDGDRDVLDARITEMVGSVAAFLDLERLDVIPTSEFRLSR